MALAGLDYRATDVEYTTFCRGYFTLPGHSHRYRDWRKGGHGSTNLNTAISQSCDVYFYALAVELGIDRMHAMMTSFGFGDLTGIDVPGEKPGLMPSRAWKRQAFSRRSDQVWFPGETVITGIGQGYTLATPLQLAHATGILATRGIRFQPRLVIATVNSVDGGRKDIAPVQLDTVQLADESYWDEVLQAMSDVVNGERGTARAISIGSPVLIAGKTGTAQVFSIGQDEEYEAEEVAERLRHHALFIAFAPVDNPQIAVSVLVENGGSGSSVAAPVARQIIDAWAQTRSTLAPMLHPESGAIR
jgi:penicillin-binding protein 2